MEQAGGIRHPCNPRTLYTRNEDGTVRVTMGTRWGLFRKDGRWLEGTMFEADPEMCLWVAARRPTGHHRISKLMETPGPAG